jgi:hypothetical protein
LINFQDCHAAVHELRQAGARAVDFKGLIEADTSIRRSQKWPVERAVVGFASVDTRVERGDPQDRFVRAVEAAGIVLEQIDYRDTYVNLPAPEEGGVRPKGVQTLAPALSFALGALSDRADPSVLLVAGSYDHAYSIRQFAARGGRVVIAFWRACADQRLFTREIDKLPNVSFVDLAEFPEVLGGVDVRVRAPEVRESRPSGISILF